MSVAFKNSNNVIHLIDGVRCNACGGDGDCIDSVTHFPSCKYQRFIVELEPGVWLAGSIGDPGRTLVKESAKQYKTRRGAAIALGIARKFRSFKNAVITTV